MRGTRAKEIRKVAVLVWAQYVTKGDTRTIRQVYRALKRAYSRYGT